MPIGALTDYDFFYVTIPEANLEDPEVAKFYFPWSGNLNYCLGAVIYMLNTGVITLDNIVYGLKASRRMSPDTLKAAYEKVKTAFAKAFVYDQDLTYIDEFPAEDQEYFRNYHKEQAEEELQALQKRGFLSWLGRCGIVESLSWAETKSMYVEDAAGVVRKREYVGDGVWKFKTATELLDLRSMRPYNDIAIQIEQCMIDRARRILERPPLSHLVVTYAWHVDAVYFTETNFDTDAALEEALAKHKYPSGAPMFKIKEALRSTAPSWKQRYEPRNIDINLETQTWRHLEEKDAGNQDVQEFFARQIIANKGGRLNAFGGAGKTVTLRLIVKLLQEEAERTGVPVRIIPMALRHAAKAQLPEGQTIAHFKHKYAKAQNMWLLVDEGGEGGAAAFAELARWKLVGCNFVICGDFDGQLLPMFDRYADVYDKKGIVDSRLMYDLVNGLSCSLSVCRRTPDDHGHFYAVKELYNRQYFRPGQPVDQEAFTRDLKRTVVEYMALYRYDKDIERAPDVVATMSHSHRLQINALLNEFKQRRQAIKKWLPWTKGKIPGATMQPQSCYIWPGIVVTGCTRSTRGREGNVTNGINYIVKSLNDEGCMLQMHPDYSQNYVAKVERNFPKLAPLIRGLVQYLLAAPRSAKDLSWYPGVDEKIDKGLTVLEALKSLGFVAVDNRVVVPAHFAKVETDEDVEPSLPTEIMGPEEFFITWADFQQSLRLTHALPYIYYQGKTISNQLLLLMNTESKHFTMRHLIMGLGRVQKAENVKICARGREETLLKRGQLAFQEYERKARENAPAEAVASVVIDEDGDVVMEEQAMTEPVPDPYEDDGFDNDSAADSEEDSACAGDMFADEDFPDA
jgi:hypothetical protein